MIDWEEFFEDINWKRAVAFLVGALVLIVVGVFLILDYHRAKILRSTLETSLADIDRFEEEWSPPNSQELEKLKAEVEKWDQVLAKSGYPIHEDPAEGFVLPVKVDLERVQSAVEQAASRNNLRVSQFSPKPEVPSGYFKILPVAVTLEKATVSSLNSFFKSISLPHGIESKMMEISGPITVTVNFYFFDQESWAREKDCGVKFATPEQPPELSGIYVFKGSLEEKRNELLQKIAGIADRKKKIVERCELEYKIERRKTECIILRDTLEVAGLKCEIK